MPAWLRTTLYLWKSTIVGFLLGLDAAWLLTISRWINMRMATGKVIPWFVAAALLAGSYTVWRPSQPDRRPLVSSAVLGWSVLVLQFILAPVLTRGDWSALLMLPAALVRDGLPVYRTVSQLNPWLLALLVLGAPALFFDPDRYCSKSESDGGTCV